MKNAWIAALVLGLAGYGWAAGYEEIEVSEGGTIAGIVRFAGTVPSQEPIGTTKDQAYCGEQIPAETYSIEEGRIQNAVVSLEGITRGKKIPTDPVVLNNHHCRFSPHILAAVVSAGVEVTNQDPVLHNTHAYFRKRTLFNMGLPIQGMKVPKKLRRRPGIVEVKCDAHEWMHAYIVVKEHPYVAVSDSSGAYTLSEVPPGTYRLQVWHEALGTQVQEVIVPPGGKVRADFSFGMKP